MGEGASIVILAAKACIVVGRDIPLIEAPLGERDRRSFYGENCQKRYAS